MFPETNPWNILESETFWIQDRSKHISALNIGGFTIYKGIYQAASGISTKIGIPVHCTRGFGDNGFAADFSINIETQKLANNKGEWPSDHGVLTCFYHTGVPSDMNGFYLVVIERRKAWRFLPKKNG